MQIDCICSLFLYRKKYSMKPYCNLRIIINKDGDVEINIVLTQKEWEVSREIIDQLNVTGFLEPVQEEMLRYIFSTEPKLSKKMLTRWLDEKTFLRN